MKTTTQSITAAIVNLDKATEPDGIVPAPHVDTVVEDGGVGRHPGTDDGALSPPHALMLAQETQQLRVLAKLTVTATSRCSLLIHIHIYSDLKVSDNTLVNKITTFMIKLLYYVRGYMLTYSLLIYINVHFSPWLQPALHLKTRKKGELV